MPVYPALTAFFDRLFSRNSSNRGSRVLFLGLDAGGKTTLLYRLAVDEIVTVIPTIGFNVETVKLPVGGSKTLEVTAWDVGGCDKIRPLWRHYFQDTQGAIFMIDSADRERLPQFIEECIFMMNEFDRPENEGRRVPFLIFANKQDLPRALKSTEIHERILAHIPNPSHPVATFPLSAIAPKAELMKQLEPAFTWLGNTIRTAESPELSASSITLVSPPLQTKEKEKKPFDPRSQELLAERLESWAVRAENDSTPEEFLEQFNTYSLPAWDHYTHIRIAYVILTTFGRQKGKNMIFDGIESYIKNSTQSTGRAFHLTMTYFWIQIVHYGIASMSPNSTLAHTPADAFMSFLIMNPHVCDGMLWSDYYEKLKIMSPKAKEEMVLPDKKHLPSLIQRDAPPKPKSK